MRSARSMLAAAALCLLGTATLTAGAERANASSLVAAAIAGDEARLRNLVAELRIRPKPVRLDRARARQHNERGLALWQRQRYAEAAVVFRVAHAADESDAEIAENLGYALLKAGDVQNAEPAIMTALELGPDRASAWGSLGLIFAKQGKHREGVAVVLTAYRFAQQPKRALDAYSRMAASDEDPKVRALLSDVMRRLPKP
ncbi:MAG TPA: tetratricopeptide repeat protein [Burkholderiales bacterium]|nr:tetratricopeptide repeat protein [Burkholderiales bacterium]